MRFFSEPGTRSMSPKEQNITSDCEAIYTALSSISMGVTHTGHPGPCISVILLGRSVSMPNFIMLWVWPPQTSIIVQSLCKMSVIALMYVRTGSEPLHSSTYFTALSLSGYRMRLWPFPPQSCLLQSLYAPVPSRPPARRPDMQDRSPFLSRRNPRRPSSDRGRCPLSLLPFPERLNTYCASKNSARLYCKHLTSGTET